MKERGWVRDKEKCARMLDGEECAVVALLSRLSTLIHNISRIKAHPPANAVIQNLFVENRHRLDVSIMHYLQTTKGKCWNTK